MEKKKKSGCTSCRYSHIPVKCHAFVMPEDNNKHLITFIYWE